MVNLALIILAMWLWIKPSHVVTRLRCLVTIPLMMNNAQLNVELSCHVVTSVPQHAVTANQGVHMRCVVTHVVDYSSVCTDAKPHAVSPVHPAAENVIDAALMQNVPNVVHNRASLVKNRAPGVVLITSATIPVERSVTALHAMLPAPRSSLAATPVLVCVERSAQHCVLFAMQKSCLPCWVEDVIKERKAQNTCSFLIVVTS